MNGLELKNINLFEVDMIELAHYAHSILGGLGLYFYFWLVSMTSS